MADLFFQLGGTVAIAGWLLLAVLPGWRLTQPFCAVAIPALLGLAYALLAALGLPGSDGGFGSIEEVRTLFANDHALSAGWLHYLAFDLFVGAFIVREARRAGLPHWGVLPCLAATFLLGPVGYLMFLGLHGLLARRGAPAGVMEAAR